MYCPNCGYKQICPCESCQKNNVVDNKPYIVNDYTVSCANCGLSMSFDKWEDIEMIVYKNIKGEKTMEQLNEQNEPLFSI